MTCLVEDFVKSTVNTTSPENFRRWSGIGMVGGALSRRVWTMTLPGLPIFSNMFIMLVAPPSVGKTLAMQAARGLLEGIVDEHGTLCIAFSPDEVTRERLVEHMGEVFKKDCEVGSRSYFALISDFGTFMPEPDTKLLQGLSHIWDCPETPVTKETKSSGKDRLWFPYMSMLAGVQPAWFEHGFPKSSYEMGMPSRTFFIHAKKEDAEPPRFFEKGAQVENARKFTGRLQEIAGLWRGFVPFNPEAQREFVDWHEAGMLPMPDDPILEGYCGRRAHHVGKLALIAAAAAHPSRLTITPKDFAQAQRWMFAAELTMPQALVAAGGNIYRTREDHVLQYVRAEFAKTGKPIAERRVRAVLGTMVSSTIIGQLIDEMIKQGRLKTRLTPGAERAEPGNRLLKPGGM